MIVVSQRTDLEHGHNDLLLHYNILSNVHPRNGFYIIITINNYYRLNMKNTNRAMYIYLVYSFLVFVVGDRRWFFRVLVYRRVVLSRVSNRSLTAVD